MPTYDYCCIKCKKTFELVQRMLDKPVAKCIHCGGKSERVIGAGAGIIFKGSGFYQTDYKNPPKETKTSSEKTTVPAPKLPTSESAKPSKKTESVTKPGASGGKNSA